MSARETALSCKCSADRTEALPKAGEVFYIVHTLGELSLGKPRLKLSFSFNQQTTTKS